ncbi:hypothetical protein V1T76_27875 [Roseibium sp. FZY0029]|uniref:hypothetical protein n=1 Tax=Roseibium sp. FZY0029 TaxID=3116647 RepID=UPI002E9ED0FD|nr:hypothetical protein [Roseibium sp. FZY0029]
MKLPSTVSGGIVAGILMVATVSPALPQSLPQYDVEAQVTAVDGGLPGPGAMVRIEIAYLDPATGKVVSGPVRPIGFMRTIRAGNDDCATAVRAYSLNKGLFKDASSLTGSLIVTANADATLSFVDPLSDLKSANIFELVQLPGIADAIVPFAGEVAILLKARGEVLAVDASGHVRSIVQGLEDVQAFGVAGPAMFVVAGNRVAGFGPGGERLFEHETEGGVTSVTVLENGQTGETQIPMLAILELDGRLSVIGALDGRPSGGFPTQANVAGVAGNASGLLLLKRDGVLHLLHARGRAPVGLDPGFRPGGLVADGFGRFGFVWSDDGSSGALIDLVAGRVADRFDLPAVPAGALFAGRSLFVNHRDDASITLIDTGPLSGVGTKAAIRIYEIKAVGRATPMAVHDADGGWIVAMPPGLSVANVYGNGNPTAPMTTTPLRGARSKAIMTLDRTFRRTVLGSYSAVGRLPMRGPVQLVTVTDDYKTIRCFDVASSAPLPETEAALAIAPDFKAVAGEPFAVALEIAQRPQGMQALPPVLNVTVRDMFGNRADRIARKHEDGSYRFDMTISAPGQYPVTAEADGFRKPVFLIVEER